MVIQRWEFLKEKNEILNLVRVSWSIAWSRSCFLTLFLEYYFFGGGTKGNYNCNQLSRGFLYVEFDLPSVHEERVTEYAFILKPEYENGIIRYN